MVTDEPFWLVVRNLFGTNDLSSWLPSGHPVIWTIVIVIVVLGRAAELRRALLHVLTALTGLAAAVGEVVQVVM